MRRLTVLLVLTLAACASDEENAREREAAMIEQARADSAAEADFVADSVALAQSITLDTIVELRVRMITETDEDGDDVTTSRYEALNRLGLSCGLDSVRYGTTVRGDTLRCQWGPE